MRKILFDSWFTNPSGELAAGSSAEVPANHQKFLTSAAAVSKDKAIIGWGGLVVLGEDDSDTSPVCAVELLRAYFDKIWRNSCGKCVPCRVGTKVIFDMLDRIAQGKGSSDDIGQLLTLAEDIRTSCKCAYGTAFQKPLRDALTHFRAHFDRHLAGQSGCLVPEAVWFMTAPCNHGCPANTDAARYIELITEEKYALADEVAYEPDAYAACLGRACFHPCETLCKRGVVDSPIAISSLKRFPTDYARKIVSEGQSEVNPYHSKKTRAKVAIIGAGPASVQCAADLARWDYDVTIFEAEKVVGGVAHLGIPQYRLPRDVVTNEVDRVRNMGVTVICNTKLGRDITFDDLRQQGYKAVFVGIGCFQGKKMGIPGEELPGVWDAIEYLKVVNLGRLDRMGKRVIIVGGGNSAIDAARLSRHLGYQDVTLVYRRTRTEMPASSWEVDEAEEEGVKFSFLAAPVRIVEREGRAAGLECLRMELGEPDATGRRKPVPKPATEHIIDGDVIVAAVSQEVEIDYFRSVAGLEITRWGTFKVNDDTMQTTVPWLFAGGDAATGPDSIILSIATGRRAAAGIDKFFNPPNGSADHTKLDTMLKMRKIIDALGCVHESEWSTDLAGDPRAQMPAIPPHNRINNMDEVEKGFDEKTALYEASRCMRCYRIIMTV